jgi:hypothetical protein
MTTNLASSILQFEFRNRGGSFQKTQRSLQSTKSGRWLLRWSTTRRDSERHIW